MSYRPLALGFCAPALRSATLGVVALLQTPRSRTIFALRVGQAPNACARRRGQLKLHQSSPAGTRRRATMSFIDEYATAIIAGAVTVIAIGAKLYECQRRPLRRGQGG